MMAIHTLDIHFAIWSYNKFGRNYGGGLGIVGQKPEFLPYHQVAAPPATSMLPACRE